MVPEVKVPYRDKIGTADEYVAQAFGFAESFVKNQKAFAGDVLDATAPVRSKFVDADAKPVAAAKKPAKATRKAA